jgi:hypothetical protein
MDPIEALQHSPHPLSGQNKSRIDPAISRIHITSYASIARRLGSSGDCYSNGRCIVSILARAIWRPRWHPFVVNRRQREPRIVRHFSKAGIFGRFDSITVISRQRNCGQNTDDSDYDHQFNQCKTARALKHHKYLDECSTKQPSNKRAKCWPPLLSTLTDHRFPNNCQRHHLIESSTGCTTVTYALNLCGPVKTGRTNALTCISAKNKPRLGGVCFTKIPECLYGP